MAVYQNLRIPVVLHCLLHCTELHCALHCTALHCTALHCTALEGCRSRVYPMGLCSNQVRALPLLVGNNKVYVFKFNNLDNTGQILPCTALHCTALHCTALHCTALDCTALLCSALHCTAPHCTVLHCTALHCTALLCTVVHCSALHCTELGPANNLSQRLAGPGSAT
jgi:hypothetical protein